jgi:hypothetical protein
LAEAEWTGRGVAGAGETRAGLGAWPRAAEGPHGAIKVRRLGARSRDRAKPAGRMAHDLG